MNKIICSIGIFIVFLSMSIPAHAELLAVDQYLSVKLGYSGIITDPVKIKGDTIIPQRGVNKQGYISTPSLALSVGTYYATEYVAVRGETEYVIRFDAGTKLSAIPTTSGSHSLTLTTTVQTVLFNLFLDFNTRTFFVPYIGAGLGASFINSKYTLNSFSKKDFHIDFSWQVNIGAAFYIVPSLAIDIQTRYSHFGEPRYGSGSPTRMIYTASGIDVLIGIRYTL